MRKTRFDLEDFINILIDSPDDDDDEQAFFNNSLCC